MIDGKNFIDQPSNSNLKTNENIRKIATGKGDHFTTGCLLMFFIIEEAKETVLDFSQGTVKDL